MTKFFSITSGLAFFSATAISTAAPSPLPERKPYLTSGRTARQDTVLKVKTFSYRGKLYEQPCFEVGQNKALYVRKIDGRNRINLDQAPAIYIDGKEVLKFMWWGSFGRGQSGYPFPDINKDRGKLVKIDAKSGTVVFQKDYIAPDKSKRTFSYTIKALPDSKVEISWNVGVTPEEMAKMPKKYGVALWFNLKNYRGTEMTVGGKKFKQSDRQTLIDKKRVVTRVNGNLIYNPADEAHGFKVIFDPPANASMTESVYVPKYGADRFSITYRQSDKPSGKLIVDFGASEVKKKVYPPVGGIDFWKNDNIHLPVSPVRNLMHNPSFEQGLRYWRFVNGGAKYTPGQGPRYKLTQPGYFGKNALLIRDTQRQAASLESFPIPLEKGKTYTLSFYAKADKSCGLTVALASAAKGGKFRGRYGTVFGDSGSKDATFRISDKWQRYSRTFTADGAGIQIILSGSNNTMIDGLQLEKGKKPTAFVLPPVEGMFTTSDPDNFIHKGKEIDAAFTFSGKPGTTGDVAVTVKNAFSESVFSDKLKVAIPPSGEQHVKLPLDEKKLGEGVFLVRADFIANGKKYTEYYRFSIMTPLSNTHATKNVFGTSLGNMVRIGRGEDLAKKFMQWGFGSTSWGFEDNDYNHTVKAPMEKKYNISNIMHTTRLRRGKYADLGNFKKWTKVTPEMEKRIEESAYIKAGHFDPKQYNTWAFGNEEESVGLAGQGKFDEYFKAQFAAAKGLKRAMPNALYAPTNGTTGYNKMRGYRGMEGYLKTAKKHNFKYDAIGIHPYGSVDKGTLSYSDLDEDIAMLIDQMKRYGYGKETPIFLPEMFNKPETYIPEWGAGPSYDDYAAGKPTYDFGNREFIQAATIARLWTIVLKYWPHVRSTNIWVNNPYLDYYQSPLMMVKVANTMGHLMPDVKYYADIKPGAGVRGYSFKLKDGSAIAPVWCIDHDVENGRARGPQIKVKFDQPVQFIDFMGNPRQAEVGADGFTTVDLTPAPIFIKAGNVEKLTQSLQKAVPNNSRSSLKVSVVPSVDGRIKVEIQNLTTALQEGKIVVAGKNIPYSVPASKAQELDIPGEVFKPEFGKLYTWDNSIKVVPASGSGETIVWDMAYLYAPEVSGKPDWSKIPAVKMGNHYYSKKYKGTKPQNDLKASLKVAWDKDNLYLLLEAEDDNFVLSPQNWKRGVADTCLYIHDGCLEVYIDTGADGRSNHSKDFDDNDYRFDFSIGKNGISGPGMVYRLREVDKQLAQGLNMPTKEEAAKNIINNFTVTPKGYIYEITFPKRYISPLNLRKGTISGFALYLHDKDNNETVGCPKGLSMATRKGSHCDHKPHLWPLLILK